MDTSRQVGEPRTAAFSNLFATDSLETANGVRVSLMNWNAIVEQVGPALLRYFCASFPRQVADELVQETIIRLVRKVETDRYNPAMGSVLKFTYGIARYVRLEAMKTLPDEILSDVAVNSEADSKSNMSDERYEQKERHKKLKVALSRLPETQRDILLLVLDEDLSLPEIAEIMEMPLGTVKSHVHRAKLSLQELMRVKEEVK